MLQLPCRLALGTLLLAAVPAAQADLVFNQQPTDLISAVPSQSSPLAPAITRAADDFTLPLGNGQAYRINAIQTRMLSTFGTADTALYRLEIYADAGGRPGALLFQQSAYNVDGFGSALGSFTAVRPAFAGGFDLLAGRRYWLSSVGLAGRPGQALFSTFNYAAAAPVGLAAMVNTNAGAWVPASSAYDAGIRDLSFSIFATQYAPPPTIAPSPASVPSPASASLLLLTALAPRRRRTPRP